MPVGLTLVVLAAGIGSRFGGPKQLADVGPHGHALMDYAIYDALKADFDKVVIVVSARTEEAIRTHSNNGCARVIDVLYVAQDSGHRYKPWGTGHAVLSARPFIDGPFAVVNADDYYGARSFQLLSDALSASVTEHVLIGYRLRGTLSEFGGVSRGLCRLECDRLESVVELHDVRREADSFTSRELSSRDLTGDEVVSTNLWGFHPEFFESLADDFSSFRDRFGADESIEYLIGTAVTSLIAQQKAVVRVLTTSDRFFGVTFRDDLPGVQARLLALIAEGQYPERLWE